MNQRLPFGRMGAVLGILYMALCYGFILLPVVVLVLFSFQSGALPVPPFNGPSLRWYQAAFTDGRLVSGFTNSLLVSGLSSALSVLIYQGAIALLAPKVQALSSPAAVCCICQC